MPKQEFLKSIRTAAEILMGYIEDGEIIRIISHNDADGIASAGILSKTMTRLDVPFRATCEKRLNEEVLRQLKSESLKIVLMSDFGSGYLKLISKNLPDQNVIVLDHHLPDESEDPSIIHLNPILQGIDGTREIASSGICYLFAKEIDNKNIDMSPLGLLGALGDQQDKGEKNTLFGLNTIVEEDAITQGLLEKKVDLIFYGYETRPIPKAIAYTSVPYIPGLSGREDSCVAFLKNLGIQAKQNGRWRSMRDLDEIEKRTLFSALSSHIISEGFNSEVIHSLIGTIYTFKNEEPWTPLRDGREYSTLLNACGRMRKTGVGLCIVMGDRGPIMKEAEETMIRYRQKIREALDWVRNSDNIIELDNIYFLRAGSAVEDTVIGVVSSILLSQRLLKSQKPLISSVCSDDELKISGRSTKHLASQGLHLGRVMQEASEGDGGGHDIAAGAYIPLEEEAKFIERVDKLVHQYIEA